MKNIEALIGLEIHQQINTNHKLFCKCEIKDEEESQGDFSRILRPAQSETGKIDPAVLFEFKKRNIMKYCFGEKNSCLVEADEEPPHELNQDALEAVIMIAISLRANIVDELHVMRKIVIDGSNTTGFQRTAITALNGELQVNKKVIKVQTICLEEDASRLIEQWENGKRFNLDRLCIPLVEVALEPISESPNQIQEIALSLGRLMRSTGTVSRGLGTIRQDINISLPGEGIVEVKGVQRLDLISKIVEYEIKRQKSLLEIKNELKRREVKEGEIDNPIDVTEIFRNTQNKILQNAIKKKGNVLAIRLPNFTKMLSHEFIQGDRIGKEMSDIVKTYGLGGVFHSDEIPIKGISDKEIKELKIMINFEKEDSFIFIAGNYDEVNSAALSLVERAKMYIIGVPSETRSPTYDGETKYSRPKSGNLRMYPETDLFPIKIGNKLISELENKLPESWEEQIKKLEKEYGLSEKLALQIIDSGYRELFEKVSRMKNISSNLAAATLTETLVSIERDGGNLSFLTDQILLDIFEGVSKGMTSKEAIPEIIKEFSSGNVKSFEKAIKNLGIKTLSNEDAEKIIYQLISENREIILERKERSISPIMGMIMKVVRGKVDGKKVNTIVSNEIRKMLESNKKIK